MSPSKPPPTCDSESDRALISTHPPSAPPPASIMTTPLPLTDPSIAPFLAHPWTASIISKSTTTATTESSSSSSSYYPIRTWSRLFKPSTGEDGYFAQTLNSPDTITHCLTLRRRSVPTGDKEAEIIPTPPKWPSARDKPSSEPRVDPPDVIMCLLLGEPGVCGHPGTVHGGVVATLVDEAMSLAVALQPPSTTITTTTSPSRGRGGNGVGEEHHPRGHIYTSQLDVRFKRPVTAPGMVVVRARVVARAGRKYWVRAHVVQEEDDAENKSGGGHLEWTKRKIVKADAMAFWLETVPEGSAKL